MIRTNKKTSIFVSTILTVLVAVIALVSVSSFSAFAAVVKYPGIEKTKTKISAPPTIVKEMKSKADLQNVKTEGVQVAIIDVSVDLSVVLDGVEVLTFLEAYSLIKGKAIPAVKISSNEEVAALTQLLNSLTGENKINDLFFVSSDVNILKSAREGYKLARGVLDYTGKEIKSAYDASADTMSATASIAIIDADKATTKLLDWWHNAYMTVWAKADASDLFGTMQLISTGVNGIVSDSASAVKECLNKINDVPTLTRKPTIVGHRGASQQDISDPTLSMGLPENSMSAFKFAYENSADVIELDIMFSSDKELVVIHDDTINRTLNVPASEGELRVDSITKEKIQSYEYVNCDEAYKSERVPILSDVFKEFKGKEIRILVELKADQTGLAEAACDLVKAEGMQSQVTFLSFFSSQLINARKALPQVSAAFLTFTPLLEVEGSINVSANIENINAITNGGTLAYAPNTGLYNGNLFTQQTIRGISFNGWTYVNPKTRNDHVGYGVQALTLDVPQWFNNKPAAITAKSNAIEVKQTAEVDLSLNVETYKGEITAADASKLVPIVISGDSVVFENNKLIAKKAGESIVVPRFQQSGYTVMGAPIKVNVVGKSNNGCGGAKQSVGMLALSVLAIFVVRRR